MKLSTGEKVHERLEITIAALISLWNKLQAQAARGCDISEGETGRDDAGRSEEEGVKWSW